MVSRNFLKNLVATNLMEFPPPLPPPHELGNAFGFKKTNAPGGGTVVLGVWVMAVGERGRGRRLQRHRRAARVFTTSPLPGFR